MVDGQTRRTLRKPNGTANGTGDNARPDSGAGNLVELESGAEPVADSDVDGTECEPVAVGDNVKRIGIVEVSPEQLDAELRESRERNGDSAGSGTGRRQRSDKGTRRGTRTRKETPQNLEPVIEMVHTWASVLLKTPELMLDKNEIKTLSDSYTEFSKYHEIPILTPKRMSEVTLVATVCMIYGPRLIAIRNRVKSEKKERPFVVRDQPKQNMHVVQ